MMVHSLMHTCIIRSHIVVNSLKPGQMTAISKTHFGQFFIFEILLSGFIRYMFALHKLIMNHMQVSTTAMNF